MGTVHLEGRARHEHDGALAIDRVELALRERLPTQQLRLVIHLGLPLVPRSQNRIGMMAATISAIQAASSAAIASRLRETR